MFRKKSSQLIFIGICLVQMSFAQESLIQFTPDYVAQHVKTKNASAVLKEDKSLQIHMDKENPLVILAAEEGFWDLSNNTSVAFELSNIGTEPTMVNCHIDGHLWSEDVLILNSGESGILRVMLKGNKLDANHPLMLYYTGMNGLPGSYLKHWVPLNAKQVKKLELSLVNPKTGADITIKNVVKEGSLAAKTYEELVASASPFVDKYGQFIFKEWPGKIHSDKEFKKIAKKEKADLNAYPGPKDRNQYGGWTQGPQLEGTGHFRVQKLQDKWWLVDPEGRLFWSHGITGVAKGAAITQVKGRKHYFAELPEPNSSYSQFGQNKKGSIIKYNFTAANLYRKYGKNWEKESKQLSHQRLKSWGMNTFGNWSDATAYLMRKTPYTVSISFPWKKVGNKLKFPNVYDPNYRTTLETTFKKHAKTWNDSYCIGYFVDNELHGWGTIGRYVLASPGNDLAKEELIAFLKRQYSTIGALNNAWATEYASWKALRNKKAKAKGKTVFKDLLTFEKQMVDLYYKTCREVIKAKAPNKLYMGSRLHNHYYPEKLSHQKWIVPIAAKYCDIISFNRYRLVPNDLVLHDPKIDKPMIIGEFHFGALDRGMLHTGLRSVQNQEQRGRMYEAYIKGALENPAIVGAHWFQYGEQAVTGRGDGENYQIGFLDVCDTPYQETINACRHVGYQLYQLRYKTD